MLDLNQTTLKHDGEIICIEMFCDLQQTNGHWIRINKNTHAQSGHCLKGR